MRGGPEPMMVTGWAQIMALNPDYIGVYHCIATNSEGQVRIKKRGFLIFPIYYIILSNCRRTPGPTSGSTGRRCRRNRRRILIRSSE